MGASRTLLSRFDAAFVNYLALTALLRTDLEAMLREESKSPHWRRNFVRATAALLEGHAHCLRQMCRVAIVAGAPAISSKQRHAIANDRSGDAISRMKYTISAAYALFTLSPRPDFSSSSWVKARRALRKRNALMHPKGPRQLGMSDSTWRRHKSGLIWLMKQFFDFLELAQNKYRS